MTCNPRDAFIKQQVRSDYCAVYASATLLSLCGRRTTKSSALRIFGVRRRSWTVPNRDAVKAALESIVGESNVALTTRKFDSIENVAVFCNGALLRTPALLMTAFCRHSEYGVTAQHAFVVTKASSGGIGIIDSLGRRPATDDVFNAWIHLPRTSTRRFVVVEGASWSMDIKSPISVFKICGIT